MVLLGSGIKHNVDSRMNSAFIRGHQLYYNFIRPHKSLFGGTPAEIANIDLDLGENKWENLLTQAVKHQKK